MTTSCASLLRHLHFQEKSTVLLLRNTVTCKKMQDGGRDDGKTYDGDNYGGFNGDGEGDDGDKYDGCSSGDDSDTLVVMMVMLMKVIL